jgi:uncharacterized membrane protein
VEILKSLSGILGILFAMPLTAFFCAVLYLKKEPPPAAPWDSSLINNND